MARCHLEPALAPRNGSVLKVIVIDRISTANQDPKSNADQRAMVHQWVEDRFDGPIEWTHISGQGSGECVDRKQVLEAEELVESGQYDLAVMEDLGRHMRRVHAVLFCELCEDMETRLVAINDDIDTFKEWRLHAFFAAMKHEASNKDTSERIKRTLRHRFAQGEVVQCPIFGYVKPQGAKNDDDLQKDPAAEPIFEEWFRRLDDGAAYSEISDWLNENGVHTGPYCRCDKWSGKMVARITKNPILKGLRVRNNMKSKRVNKSGKYKSVKARPDERLERCCPHLAFFEPQYYDRVIRKVKQRNAGCRPGRPGSKHPCSGRPKKRTVWPGQHIFCGICGRLYRYGGHGQNDHLLCRGAYEYRCWNAITVDGPEAAEKIASAVFDEISRLPEFDSTLIAMIREESEKLDSHREERIRELANADQKLDREIQNVMGAVRQTGGSPSLLAELARLEADKERNQLVRDELEQTPRQAIDIPSIEEVKRLARESFEGLAVDSLEFGRHIRRLIPKIKVFPCRLIDGGHIVLRARFTLNLAPLVSGGDQPDDLLESLTRTMNVDLFDPPQREEFRERVVALRSAINPKTGKNHTEAEVARNCGITITAAQRAAALQRKMDQLGLSDPFVPVTEPPGDYKKLRRHQHRRYSFRPLEDAGQT